MLLRGLFIGAVVLVACAVAAIAALTFDSADKLSARGPDAAVGRWPHWTGSVTCGSAPFDPLVAFSRPTDAAEGDRPAEVAFRRFLEAGGLMGGDPKPLNGWRLLDETDGYAEFANGGLADGSVKTWTVGRYQGHWQALSYSATCRPTVLRHGQAAITWSLARGTDLTPSTRTVRIDLGAGECAGGRSQDQRLERPRFRVDGGALLMALWIRPVPVGRSYTCVGSTEPAVTIHLPRALGNLTLYDGGTFPPWPADKARPEI